MGHWIGFFYLLLSAISAENKSFGKKKAGPFLTLLSVRKIY